MNKSLLPAAYKIAFLSFFLVSFLCSNESNAQAVFVSARHETVSQRQIDVTFDRAVASGSPSIVGWTIQIGGVNVPFTNQGNFGPNTIRFEFDASAIAGHGGTQAFLKPGETLRVSRVAGGGINAFGFQNSQNNFVFNCGEMIFFKQEAYSSVDVCSPVVMNFTQFVYRLSLRFRNSSAFNLANIFYNIAWGDAATQNASPYLSDISGAANASFIDNTGFTGSNPAVILTSRPTHNYPAANPGDCSFNFSLTPFVSGVANCPSITATTLFATYDTDNANSGTVGMQPSVVGADQVCLGTNVNMMFSDVTNLNCRAAIEPIVPNDQGRHIRIVYGSQNLATNIPDIRVGGVPVTSNNAAGTLLFPGGYFPTGAGGIGVPDFNGVIQLATPVTAATATTFMQQITTNSAVNHVLGDRFFVRLEYWDICNPYNAGNLTSPAPVTIERFVVIIDKPAALTTSGLSICYTNPNSTAFNFTAAGGVAGRTAVNWYRNLASVATATRMTNPNGNNSLTFPASAYGAQGGIGGNFRSDNTNGRYYSVWATQVVGATNSCESSPVEIVIIQQPRIDAAPNIPSTPLGATDVCNGPPAVVENYTSSAPGNKIIPATTSTNGSAITLDLENSWSLNGFAATVTITPNASTTDASVTYNISPQPNPSDAGQVRVRRQYKTGLADRIPVVSPLPAPFTLPTYQITPQACQNNNVNLDVTVWGQSDGGTITGSPTICEGVSTGNMTLSGHRGAVIRWERSFNAGIFVAIGGTAGLTTFSEVPPSGAGTYKYRALVQNQNAGGPCAPVTTIVANQNTVTVNPVPAKPTIGASGPTTFCFGGNVTLTSSNVGGLAASYRWYRNGVFTGTTASNIVLTTVAQSGDYTVEVIGVAPSNCVSPLSDPINVTINSRPTVVATGGGSACFGTPAPDIDFTLTGTGPFNFTITASTAVPGFPINQVGYASNVFTITAPNPAATTTFNMTVLSDANGCAANTLPIGRTVNVQLIPPPTVENFTAQAPVCDDGGATNPPDAILDLAPDIVANYAITYRLRRVSTNTFLAGSINFAGNSSATGIINLAPTYAQFGAVPNDPQGYQIVITAIQNTGTLCAGAVPINGPILIINPRPPAPTGAVPGIACSTAPTGSVISVTAPAVGFTVVWSSTAAPTFTAATGVTGGTRGNSFTPTSNATATYHAFTRDDVVPTNCLSAASLPVGHTRDLIPAAAAAGPNQPLLCGTSTTLAATAVNNGGNGVWSVVGPVGAIVITTPTSPTSTVTGLPQDVPGGAPIVTTLRWTANSALGVCPPSTSDVLLTVNPLPVVNNLTPILCEDLFLGASTANVDLTTFSAGVMGGAPANTVVQYYPSAADRTSGTNEILAPILVTNAMVRFTRVRNTVTGCISDGTITFTVRTLPVVTNQSIQICEDFPPGSNERTGLNLQDYENSITGGVANRDVEWYTDPSLAIGFLIPPGVGLGAEQNFTISADVTLHAKVIDTTPATPQCFRAATLNLDYQARPNDNQISDGIGQVLGATYTVCASNNLVLLQINPGLNPGATWTWTVPPVSYPGEFELLSATTGFFIILRFQNPIPGGGTLYPTGVPISVKETLGTALCDGNTINTRIIVEGSPPQPIITGPSSVCSNENGVVFSITNPIAGNYSWTIPAGATITSPIVTASSITVQMSTFSGNVTAIHSSGNGCTSPAAAPFPVTVVNRPIITSVSSRTVCSGTDMSVAHTLTSNIVGTTFNWEVINITGSVIGSIFGDLANGVLSINQTLSNTSGVNAAVTYRITPIGPGPDNCPGIPQNFTVTVNPEPVILPAQSKTICSANSVAKEILLTPSNLPAGTLFNWPDPDGGGPATGGVNIPMGVAGTIHINDVLVNLTNAPIVVNYMITPTSGASCVGVAETIAITVNPQPVGAADNTPIVCSGLPAGYDLESNIATLGNNLIVGNTYSWVATANGNVTGESTTNQSGKIITDVLRNFTNADQVVRYTATPTSAAGCNGVFFVIDVTVRPEPRGFNDASPLVCSDDNVNYDLSANIANTGAGGNNLITGTTYSWIAASNTNVTGESIVAQAGPVINDVINNITNSSQVVVYTVTPTSALGCAGSPFTVSVTVRPEPKGFNDASPIICSDVNVSYNIEANILNTGLGGNGLISGTTYAWTAVANPNVGGEGNGTGSTITNVLNNITNVNQIVDYTVVATSGNGCVGDPFTVSVSVRPEPRGFNDATPMICSDGAVGYSLNANIANTGAGGNNLVAGTTYTWIAASNVSVVGESTTSQSGATITDLLNNITNSNQVVAYTVTPTSVSGCVGDPFTVSVTVQPEPQGYNDATPIVCSDVALAYDLSANVANTGLGGNNLITGTTYSWIATNNATVGGESTVAQAGPVINDVLNNVTNSNQIVVYTVTPTSADGCVGNPFTVSITVRPEPRGFDDNSPIACSDVSINYDLVSNITNVGLGGNNLAIGTTYSWVAVDNGNVTGESIVAKSGSTINDVVNNVTSASEVVVYTVTPTSADGCVGNQFTVSVSVRPEPRGFDDTALVCSDVASSYSLSGNVANVGSGGNNLIVGTTYSWVAVNNVNVTGESLLPQTGATITDIINNVTNSNQNVVYTITPTSANGCVGNPFTVTLTVQPEPRGFNDNSPIICSDATVNYDLNSNISNTGSGGNNLIAGTTYSWVAASNSNVGGESLAPQAGSTITDVLTNSTNGNEVVVYSVTPTSVDGCVGNVFTVSINVRPEPRGFDDNTPIVCSDVSVNYNLVANITNTASGGNNLAVGTTYSWIAADNINVTGESLAAQAGSTINDVINNITNGSEIVVYTVTPTSVNGCVGDPFILSVTVRPEPKGFNDATPIICSDTAVGYNLVANIANVGSGGNNLTVGTTYSWIAASNGSVGGESTSAQTGTTITDVLTNITNANQTVVYTITPTSANGCVGNPFTVSVLVQPEPKGFNDATPVICSDAFVNYDLSANIANTGLGGNNLITGTTYSWVAANNANITGESTVAQAGTTITDVLNNITNSNQIVVYTITPTSADGCLGKVFTVSITVRPEPKGFDDNSPIRCSDVVINYDLVANISNIGLGGNSLITGTTYSWIAADNINVSGESSITPGTSSSITDVINNITNIDQVVVYTVTPTSSNGCVGDPFIVSVTIRPEPKGFNDATPLACSDVAFNYDLTTNIANVGSGGNNLVVGTTYSWVAAPNAFVTGEGSGTSSILNDVINNVTTSNQIVVYTVTPTSGNGCVGNPFTVSVTIQPEPRGFNDNTPVICSDASVAYNLSANIANTVSGGNNLVAGTTYSWVAANNPNVGGESTVAQVGATISDALNNITNVNQVVVYTITPTSALGCDGNPFIVSVTVRPEPRGFDDTKTICSDANVNYDLTSNIGNTGSGGNNLLIGTTYSWIAANNPNVSGETSVTPGTSITITDVLNNITDIDQVVVYTVTATSNNGCVGDPFTVSITVRPEPRGFNDNSTFICSDGTVGYSLLSNIADTGNGGNNLITGTTYSWVAAANGSVSGESTVAVAGAIITDVLNNITNLDQVVVYTVVPTSSVGCIGDPFTVSVTVRPEPKGFNDNSPIICSKGNVNYDLTTNISNTGSGGNNLVAGTTYSWLAADNPSVTGETLVAANTSLINDALINVTAANQVVVYTVTPTSGNGCVGDPFTVSVTVRPEPIGLADTDAVCSDEQINYNIQTRNINLLGNSVASQFTYTVVSSDPGNVSAAGKNRPVASNAAITDTYTNTTSADVTLTYSITPLSTTGNCIGTPFDVVFTIHPEPLGVNTLAQRCSDDPVNFDLQTIINAGTGNSVPSKFRYSVVSSNPLAIAPGPNRNVATTAVIADVYTNTTNADVEITYTVTPVSLANDCEGSVFTLRVTIHPEPVGANVVDPVCSTGLNYNIQTQNINTLGNGVPSVFTYTVASTDAINVPPAPDRVVADNLPITDTYTNSTGVDVTVTYTITPFSSANNCAGTPFTYAVTISSKPVGADVTKPDVCSDVAFNFNPQADITNGVIATFTWTAVYQPGLTISGAAPPASGTGSISGILTNTGSSILNATYTVTPTAGTCVGNPFVITVPIQPEPVVATTLNEIVCSRAPYNKLLDTNGLSIGATNYDVTAVVDAGLTGVPTTGLGLAANALLNDAFQNVGTIPLKVTYTITPHGTNGCVGDPKIVELTVNPEPVVNPALDNTVCSREISGIILSTNGTSVAANSYRLIGVVVPGTVTADPLNVATGTTGNINLIRNDKYVNNTSAPVVVVYEVIGISPALCEGQSGFINLTINPEPIMGPGTANLCSDVPSGIIVGPIVGSATITQYELKNVVKAPALVAGGSNAGLGTYPANLAGGQSDFLSNDTFTNTTNGPLVVTYTVVPIASGCRGQDQSVVFTVNPAPAVDDNLNRTVCSDDTAGIVFATETSPPSTAAASYNITVIAVQAGLVRTAGNAVFPRNGVTANDIQADQFRNPTNDPLTVTYSVQAVSGSSCLGPVRNIVLTVEPQVIAAPINNAPSICSTDQTDIDLISPTNPTSGVITFNYTAVSSVGGLISGFVPSLNSLPENYKITDALVNNSDNPATVTYTITANANGAKNGAGCSSIAPAATVVVTVDPKPKLVATPSIQTVCEGVATNVTLNSNTVPSGGGNVRFELLSAAATGGVTGMSAVGTLFTPGSALAEVLDNPTITAQTVTYTLQPKVIGGLGCIGDNVVVTITVNPLPTVVASAQTDICSGDFVNITLTPDVVNTVAIWTVSAPATIAGASNGAGNLIFQTLFNNGNIPETVNYTVTPRVNGCNGTPIVIGVVVNPKPKFVGLPTTVTVCHGNTLNVPLNSTVAGTTFDWVVDDPSGLGVPVTGSGNVINQPMTNTTGSQASLTYTITPTGPGSCPGDQKIMIVAVSPQISAQFLNASSSICKGSSEFLIIEVQGQAPFQIVYNDGTSDITLNNAGNVKVVQVTPTVTTTYTIMSIRDALNCSFLPVGQAVTVTVGETDANFSIVGPTSSCGPYNATFQFNQVAGTEYTWQWFDGSPDEIFLAATTIPNNTITHVFTNPNPNAAITYKVTLRTQLPAPFPGCFKSTTQNVTVFPSIITNAFPDRSEICSGESIQFFNQSFGATSHRWFYRVQGTATEIDIRTTPTVNYNFVNTSTSNPIIYEVVYQANNGNCPAADVVIPITVYRAITAGFDEGTIPPFIGGNSTVTFANTSVPIDASQFRYEWTFGLNSTPSTGLGAGPFSVNYSTPGVRDVSLKVVNIDAETAGLGCESSFSKTINIPLLPLVAAFKADPQRACFPSDFTVTENTSTGDLMDWRVVDSNGRVAATSNAPLPVFRITSPGSYSIFLTTSNSLTGQVANTQQSGFEVFDNPFASFDLRPNVVYVPDTELTTFNFSTGATDYDWDFGDGGTSFDLEPTYVYKVEGVYEVRLIARNDHGQGLVCTDTLVRTVTAKQGGVTKVPNAFTPNPNGPSGGSGSGGSGTFNDVFLPIVKGAEEFNMQIFDRWGNLIFESNSANVGWDGYDKDGRLLPAGVFVYKLTIRLSDGQRSTQIGDVTMIR